MIFRALLRTTFALLGALLISGRAMAQEADSTPPVAMPESYLSDFGAQARIEWPKNRTLRVVSHGHSVPAGYFRTPEVLTMDSYPHLLHKSLAAKYPNAVINVVVTAIGGENAEEGAKRFEDSVLSLNPDVVTIDYALNDRALGLERAKVAWESMIAQAKAKGIKLILMTPTPDTGAKLDEPTDPLNQHSAQIRVLARKHGLAVADSMAAFREEVKNGVKLDSLMSQANHPNAKGHALVARELARWFP